MFINPANIDIVKLF